MIQRKLTSVRRWWARFGKQLTVLWLVVSTTIGVVLYNGHKSDECFKEYFGVQVYRGYKTDDLIKDVQKLAENNRDWTFELSHPPDAVLNEFGPKRTEWLQGIGARATERSNELLAQMTDTLDDKADHPYPVVRCGR